MARSDVSLLVLNPFETETFRLSFYENGKKPVPAATVEQLCERIKQSVGELPGTSVSGECSK